MDPKPGAEDPAAQQTSDRPAQVGMQSGMNRRWRYRIDREHPIGGEMSDIVKGLFTRMRLPWLLGHHAQTPVLAIFSFINGCISIGIMSALALVTHTAFIFPSLGPTAFLFFYTPTAPAASPRNTIVGHAIGVLAGYFSLVVTGLTMAGPALSVGVTWPRVLAAALSLGLTAGLMVLLRSPHPPAGATTLIISLGLLTKPLQLLILMVAVVLLTLQAFIINRLSGIPYPLWNPRREPDEEGKKTRDSVKSS
ncbi:MAG TPA: HPP family protein [Ktedonobacteraceae bacterium]|nr:HPP family protein [Ktedonobacteraceae bacterium]